VEAGGVAAIALVGLVPAVADLVAAALRSEGHAVARRPLDADVVRELGRAPPDVLVLDGHAYANTRVLLADLRAHPALRGRPVVVLGPARPAEVPHFEVVQRLGRTFSLDELLVAVRRAAGARGG
jgi:DNA-binding response OmpR family regulator